MSTNSDAVTQEDRELADKLRDFVQDLLLNPTVENCDLSARYAPLIASYRLAATAALRKELDATIEFERDQKWKLAQTVYQMEGEAKDLRARLAAAEKECQQLREQEVNHLDAIAAQQAELDALRADRGPRIVILGDGKHKVASGRGVPNGEKIITISKLDGDHKPGDVLPLELESLSKAEIAIFLTNRTAAEVVFEVAKRALDRFAEEEAARKPAAP